MKKLLSVLLFCLLTVSGVNAQSLISDTYHHPWAGKRVAYLGDSVTDPNNRGSKTKYWGFLDQWLGTSSYVYAKSGRQWNDIPRQAGQLQQEHGDSVDAIVIFVGTNNFNGSQPIGKWWEETEEEVVAAHGKDIPRATYKRLRRKPVMTQDSYCGSINVALDSVKRMYPTKQIVLLTPIHRAYFCSGETNEQPAEDYQNNCGEWFETYVEKVREAGRIWSVPVIDLNSLSGLFPLSEEYARFFRDKDRDLLHPNDEGHRRLALTLYYQLATLPATFE